MRSFLYYAISIALSASLGSTLSVPHVARQCSNPLTRNGVKIGFLPSDGSSKSGPYTMSSINSKLGAKAATYGRYAQITSGNFDGSQLTAVLPDVKASGAIFVASVMPYIDFKDVTTDVAKKVAAVMKKFTDQGIEVWLRFGHEMNWYTVDDQKTYHGTPTTFIAAWKNIYDANCANNKKVKCFWSPNRVANVADLDQWWPGKKYVDIVGIDAYPKAEESTSDPKLFDKLYGNFYKRFSEKNNLPFAIGETGAGNGQKHAWLKQLISQDRSKYPNYVSMSWFEFDKEVDFRIVESDDATLKKTLDTLGSC